jgi:hypothetical protein
MEPLNPAKPERDSAQQRIKEQLEAPSKADWETPTLEDVSEQVMAQPYIRFT